MTKANIHAFFRKFGPSASPVSRKVLLSIKFTSCLTAEWLH